MHRRLLVLLAMRPNRPVTSQTLVDELWEGVAPRTAESVFRTYIAAVRQVLDRGQSDADLGRLPPRRPDTCFASRRTSSTRGTSRSW